MKRISKKIMVIRLRKLWIFCPVIIEFWVLGLWRFRWQRRKMRIMLSIKICHCIHYKICQNMSLYPLFNTWDTKYVTVSNTWAIKYTVTSYFTKYALCSGVIHCFGDTNTCSNRNRWDYYLLQITLTIRFCCSVLIWTGCLRHCWQRWWLQWW